MSYPNNSVSEPISPPLLEQLRSIPTCAVANAIEQMKVRLRNEGFTNGSIRCFSACQTPFIGHAVTVRIRCSTPPTDGHDYLESTRWWNFVLSIPEPRIVVIQDVDPFPGTGALVGEIHANILQALGCIGVVTNGSIRDLAALERIGFHAFASQLAVSHAYSHIVEMSGPVEIAGLKIFSGDLLHGDLHGLISIPLGTESKIPLMAARIARREQTIIELCKPSEFSIDTLREGIRALREDEP